MGDPLYRIRQFLAALRARPLTHAEQARVRTVLNEPAFALYQTMPPGDQRHSLAILDALVAQGQTARPLLVAALLHDVAKRTVGPSYRTGAVLLNKLGSDTLACAASPIPGSWRYPFYLSLHHPELGAELALRAGVDEQTAALIRAHQACASPFEAARQPQLAEWHRALRALDDVN